MSGMIDELLTIPETAKKLRVSVSTLRTWVFQRKIVFVKLGGKILFRVEDINAWIAKCVVPVRDQK